MKAFEMASPRPVPFFALASPTAAWANFWNMRDLNSSGIPGPWSETDTRTLLPQGEIRRLTVSPRGENLQALDTRFVRTCIRRSVSPKTTQDLGAAWYSSRTPQE